MAWLPTYVNNTDWLKAFACNVAGGRHAVQLLHEMLQNYSCQIACDISCNNRKAGHMVQFSHCAQCRIVCAVLSAMETKPTDPCCTDPEFVS